MSILPLYEKLLATSSETISDAQRKDTCHKLNKLGAVNMEEVSVLIIHYLVKSIGETYFKSKIPYGIKIGFSGRGLSFHLDALPLELQRVLCEYCK